MTYLNLAILGLLGFLAIGARASECGDGSDDSVANCCMADQGTCENCAVGYGLSTDGTQCNKCKSPTCGDCPGNPSVCKTQVNKPIPNCAYSDGYNQQCFDCKDGFSPSADSKKCVKCTAPNCSVCNPKKPATCSICSGGFGLIKGKCQQCKIPNCDICSSSLSACVYCSTGYGKTKGKPGCVKCPANSVLCDYGKLSCRGGYGTYAKAGTCTKCNVKGCEVCNKTGCDVKPVV